MSKEKNEGLVSVQWDDDVVPSFLENDIKDAADPDEGDVVIEKDILDDNVKILEDIENIPKSKKGDDNLKQDSKEKTKDKKISDDADVIDKDADDEVEQPPLEKSKNSPALVFAKFLNEKGVVNLNEEDIKKIQNLVEEEGDENALEFIFNKEVDNRISSIKESYDNEVKEYLELRELGIDSDIASKLVRNKNLIDQISDNDIENEENLPLRKQIIKQYLTLTTKMSEDEINDYTETLVDTNKDVTWAKKSLVALKEHNKKLIQQEKERIKNEEVEQEKRIKETKEIIKKTVFDTNEIFGNELTTNMKNKIVKMLTEPAGKDAEGNPVDGVVAWILQDPLMNRIKLAYAIESGLLNGKLNTIKRKIRNEIIEELENSVISKSNLVGGSNYRGQKNSTMEALKNIFGE